MFSTNLYQIETSKTCPQQRVNLARPVSDHRWVNLIGPQILNLCNRFTSFSAGRSPTALGLKLDL